ncbi:uncharacterized protein LOC142169793 [Nicotiana tabacum]|uniref:Uncharacterized protein LOC142169793 n=1 Tax=Nicotiana tabacum TaxID=4097 RepID=A0AC58SS73_TOBAC
MVIAWLLNSLSKDIAESVIYSQTAEDLWNELEQRYGQADGTKLFQLQRELNNINQGTKDVAGYFTKLKRIWDQMKVLNTFMTCNCDCKYAAKSHNHKMNEDQKLIQFLMGLNDIYSGVRDNILMTKPLPTTAQTYSIILQEETQREIHSGNHVSTKSAAFMLTGQRWNRQRNIAKRQDIFGYLKHFKISKQRKRGYGNHQANEVNAEEGDNGGTGANAMLTSVNSQGFTKEQHEKLIQMFRTVQGSSGSTSNFEPGVSANLAGATHYMEYDRNLLHNIKKLSNPIFINLPNSYKVKVTIVGSLFLNSDLEIHNVLVVSTFKHNLLSVYQLCKQVNCILIFTKHGCFIQSPSMKMYQLFGEATCLYIQKDNTYQALSKLHVQVSPVASQLPKCNAIESCPFVSKSACSKSLSHVYSESLSPVCHENLNERTNEIIPNCNVSTL